MRRIWIIVFIAALVALVPASAGAGNLLAGGGGHGGQCMEEPPEAAEVGVAVGDSCFRPETIGIEAGQSVTWEPVTPGAHTVTFASDGPDSGQLMEPFAVRFRQPGTYLYSCLYHPGMVGAVEVNGEAMDGEALEIVPTGGVTSGSGSLEALPQAELASSGTQTVTLQIEPLSALLLILIGLAFGSGAVAVGKTLRG